MMAAGERGDRAVKKWTFKNKIPAQSTSRIIFNFHLCRVFFRKQERSPGLRKGIRKGRLEEEPKPPRAAVRVKGNVLSWELGGHSTCEPHFYGKFFINHSIG